MKTKDRLILSTLHSGSAMDYLVRELERRRQKNPQYSLRAYARDLDIDQSLLTKILSGNRKPSETFLLNCLKKIDAPKEIINAVLRDRLSPLQYEVLDDEKFDAISDWKKFAILELMTLPGIELTTEVVATKLGLDSEAAGKLISSLLKTGMIEESDGKLILTKSATTWYPETTTSASKIRFQKDLLQLSSEALANRKLEDREHSSVILALKKEDLPRYKQWVREASQQLTQLFQSNGDFDDVYCLQVSLFPLTQPEITE